MSIKQCCGVASKSKIILFLLFVSRGKRVGSGTESFFHPDGAAEPHQKDASPQHWCENKIYLYVSFATNLFELRMSFDQDEANFFS
jgi:hypothetical protein